MKVLLFSCLLLAALQFGQSSVVPKQSITENERNEMSLKLDPVACGKIVIRELTRRFPKILSLCIEDAKEDPSDSLPPLVCVALGVAEKVVSVLQRAPECSSRSSLVLSEAPLKLNPLACGNAVIKELSRRFSKILSVCLEDGVLAAPLCVALGVAEKVASVIQRAPECH